MIGFGKSDEMSDEDKILRMFDILHGIPKSGSCYVEISKDEHDWEEKPTGVNLMKDGNVCWTKTREELMFEYITKDWKHNDRLQNTF